MPSRQVSLYRRTTGGTYQTLRPVEPDSTQGRTLLADWLASDSGPLASPLPPLLVARGTPLGFDSRADFLFLTEHGALGVVLVVTGTEVVPEALLGMVTAADCWAAAAGYDRVEGLLNESSSEPHALLEAHRAHFAAASSEPPQTLCRQHAVVVLLPQGADPQLETPLAFLAERGTPVCVLRYEAFAFGENGSDADDDEDTFLSVTPTVARHCLLTGQQHAGGSVARSTFDALIATVCHHVNNPLGGIMGVTQLLQTRDDLDEETRAQVTEIEEAAARVGTFTHALYRLRAQGEPALVTVAGTEMVQLE